MSPVDSHQRAVGREITGVYLGGSDVILDQKAGDVSDEQ